MPDANLREAAHCLIDDLPPSATWEDLMYNIYVRQAVEAGLEDCRADRVVDVDDLRAKFGLPK